MVTKEKQLLCLALTRVWDLLRRGCCMSWGQMSIPSAAGTDGAVGWTFLLWVNCMLILYLQGNFQRRLTPYSSRGIDLRADASNSVEMQKVNFLGYKYLLEKVFSK